MVGYVCAECFIDEDIKQLIEDSADEKECSFCGKISEEPIAALLEDVGEHIRECVLRVYTDPANVLMYVSREGGYQGTVYNTEELLYEIIGLVDDYGTELASLIVDIVDSEGIDAWCEDNYYGTSQEENLIYSWNHFCYIVTSKRRFFFNDIENNPLDREQLKPSEILNSLQAAITEFDLISTLSSNQSLYRVRYIEGGEDYTTPSELGPPPFEKAVQANRMSPPGIPMFYSAYKLTTALKETVNNEGKFTVSLWHVKEDIPILDLTKLPNLIGFFSVQDPIEGKEMIPFLHHFVDNLSKPVVRDKSTAHIDYVPTQIFTEFIRFMNSKNDELDIMGILYPSAVDGGKPSLVLFATQEEVEGACDDEFGNSNPWLYMSKYRDLKILENKIAEWKEEEENKRFGLASFWR